MRPLYIAGQEGASLTADGPSLVYKRPGRSALRFPLSRVSRVVVHGHAGLDEAAVRACAGSGIAVGLLDRHGRPVGFVVPWQPRWPRPSELLEEFLMRRDWASRFEDWRRSEQRRAILKALPAARNDPALRHPERARRALEESLRDRRGLELLQLWKPMLAVVVHSKLSEAGLDPTLLAGRRPGFDLAAAFCELLGWSHYAHARDCCVAPPSWFEVVSAYERIRERDEQRAAALGERLLGWVGGRRWE